MAMFLENTEAYLVELVGLVVQDIDLENGGLYIRPNDIRGLKTKNFCLDSASVRAVPKIGKQ